MATMLIRLIVALFASIQVVSACDCIRLPVKNAKRGSEVVFQGTVVAMHESDQHVPVATFKVIRVWKGNVSENFEMPAFQEVQSCIGFLPEVKVGSDFLVYARRVDLCTSEYLPLPCQTELTPKAGDQIRALGRFRKPKKSR